MQLRRSAFGVGCWSLALGLLASPSTAERRALLIGIDDYSGLHVEAPSEGERWPPGTEEGARQWRSLSGAVSDVTAFASMLRETYALSEPNIVQLVNGAATRAGIKRAIARLTAGSRAGDEVLVYYSGHGSQIRSPSPRRGVTVESDALDETIVPADSNRGAADLRDKELRLLLNRLLDRGVDLVVIFDSCHSGSGVRGPGTLTRRAMAPVVVPHSAAIDPGPPLVDRGALIMAASLDNQEAYEQCVGDDCFGAFTRALLESMRLASPEVSINDLFRRTRARLRLFNHMQEPTLLGLPAARYRALFGGRRDRRDGKASIAVEATRDDGHLIVQAGWVNGLTVDSELEVPGRPLVARIVALDGLDRAVAKLIPTATSRVSGTMPVQLEPGTILSLRAWAPPPGESLRVWIPPASDGSSALQSTDLPASAGDPNLTVGQPLPADLRRQLVHLLTARTSAVELVPEARDADYLLVSSRADKDHRWAWIHRRHLEPHASTSDLPTRSDWILASMPEAAAELRQSVETLARVYGWLTLTGHETRASFPYRLAIVEDKAAPARMSALGAKHRLTGGRLLPDRRYHTILWSTTDALKRSPQARFVYVFTVDSHGQSVLLFPREGNIENRFPRIPSGARRLPVSVMLERASFEVVEPFGRDIYFLFSSSEPIHDVGVFEWDGARTRGTPRNALERLIAATAAGRRGTRSEAVPASWSIERLVFETTKQPIRH